MTLKNGGRMDTLSFEDLLLNLSILKYLGKKCEVCSKVYDTIETFKQADPICTSNDVAQDIKLACRECFEQSKKEENKTCNG
jgi:hypothetical protein